MPGRPITTAMIFRGLLFFAVVSGILTEDAFAGGDNYCATCHKKIEASGRFRHPALDTGCESCHTKSGNKEHPAKPNSMKLIENLPDLCFRCHDRGKFSKKCTHKVALGGCGKRCHNPHASDYPRLLLLPINETCIHCHQDQETGKHVASLGGKIHPLSGVRDPRNRKNEMSCVSCHDPHSADNAKLFVSKRGCQMCHKRY